MKQLASCSEQRKKEKKMFLIPQVVRNGDGAVRARGLDVARVHNLAVAADLTD